MSRNIQGVINRAVRSLRRTAFRRVTRGRRGRQAQAGFVLPTVVMVLLVVVLLSIAILLRSFDRAKIAQYNRVDEVVLQAATPALDRARTKLSDLLGGGTESRNAGLSSRGIPSESSLYAALSDTGLYSFPDEERLQVGFGGGASTVCTQSNLDTCNRMNTVWRFPVDTDNNGQYDSLAYYSIFLRTPTTGAGGVEARARKPLDARALPVDMGSVSPACQAAAGTSASLLGERGWLKLSSGSLKKSFFVYTVTVPITEQQLATNNLVTSGGLTAADYEVFKGTPAFSALELQQDYSRDPITNNAVIYEDDLDISPTPLLNLNGRIVANSNLIISPRSTDNGIKLYLVSAPASCFYNADNNKIQVAGNVVVGVLGTTTIERATEVHLFDPTLNPGNNLPAAKRKSLTSSNDSVSNDPDVVLYNNLAFDQRLDALKTFDSTPLDDDPDYYKKRTRKVPFAEVAEGGTTTATLQTVQGEVGPDFNSMVPVADDGVNTGDRSAMDLVVNNLPATQPVQGDENFQKAGENEIGDRILVGNGLPLRYVFPQNASTGDWQGPEYQMPITGGQWAGGVAGRYRQTQVVEVPSGGDIIRNSDWERDAVREPIEPSEGVGGLLVVTGAGVFNRANSFLPPPTFFNGTQNLNTLNINTTTLKPSASGTPFTVVWPDTMPMSPPVSSPFITAKSSEVYDNSSLYQADGVTPAASFSTDVRDLSLGDQPLQTAPFGSTKYAKGDMVMRATVVYHYASRDDDDGVDGNGVGINDKIRLDELGLRPQLAIGDIAPIACVSSYYDPSTALTAKNETGLPWNNTITTGGRSNNGIVYPVPSSFDATALTAQSKLVYPDGRLVNKPLFTAMLKGTGSSALTIEEHAAIYAAQCALNIYNNPTSFVGAAANTVPIPGAARLTANYTQLPHGAIREAAFLDGRQVKALDKNDTGTTVDETFSLLVDRTGTPATANLDDDYRFSPENRYPLEVRVTQLDLNVLRNTQVTQTIAATDAPRLSSGGGEYMLPLSGIIYATRDDALQDLSDTRDPLDGEPKDLKVSFSGSDYKIDPSRRPNGIMLINGERLARNDANDDGQNDIGSPSRNEVVYEKGLILASNLPVYLWGTFNLHTQEEFTNNLVQPTWDNFYTRDTLNPNFACRRGDPRLPNCNANADDWRAATILSDAITVLTRQDGQVKHGFRFGFRNEGDFDLRNNAGDVVVGGGYNFDANTILSTSPTAIAESSVGLDLNGDGDTSDSFVETQITAKMARLLNGFNPYNDFAVNGLTMGSGTDGGFDTDQDGTINTAAAEPNEVYTDADYRTATGNNPANSSYFNSFVTPVQRRIQFSEYVMEICLKAFVAACQPG
ncbi:MAG: hypothetical protein HC835_02850 [Oscillatoriales cyanobacterium RM2_1_1]|nr:hypothetical protein [Oscillatoriales cyanobacterium RM2_1_1]